MHPCLRGLSLKISDASGRDGPETHDDCPRCLSCRASGHAWDFGSANPRRRARANDSLRYYTNVHHRRKSRVRARILQHAEPPGHRRLRQSDVRANLSQYDASDHQAAMCRQTDLRRRPRRRLHDPRKLRANAARPVGEWLPELCVRQPTVRLSGSVMKILIVKWRKR
jgi:hypothetical protein